MSEHRRFQYRRIGRRPSSVVVVLVGMAALRIGFLSLTPAHAQLAPPCCSIAGVDARTGLVSAYVNATKQPFAFLVTDQTTRRFLQIGAGVYANFSMRTASLDGRTPCGPILLFGKANAWSQLAAARRSLDVPPGQKPSLRPNMPMGRFSATAPVGSAQNPGVIVSVDWARSNALPLRSILPGGRFSIISAAEYNAVTGRATRQTVPFDTLLRQRHGVAIDNYFIVDATASGPSSQRPTPPQGGGVSGSNASGTNTPNTTDPAAFIASAQPGDIVFASHPGFNYDTFGDFNHAAMVITPKFVWGDATEGEAILAEETADHPGTDRPGARLVAWSDFIDPSRKYNKIALGRVRGLGDQQLNIVINWAISRVGRPYRWPTDVAAKDDDSRMYCSQYVWIDYLRNINLDLDSDGGYIVFPDDIYYDQNVQRIGDLDLPTSSSWWPF